MTVVRYPSSSLYPSLNIYPANDAFPILIFDRVEADIAYRNQLHDKVASSTATDSEIAEWNSDALKGSYNYTDMNRVGTALNAIKILSDGIGRQIVYPFTNVTTFSRSTLPTQDDIYKILTNVSVAKNVYRELSNVVPSSIKTIYSANAIEKILYDIYLIIGSTTISYVYTGEVYCGGD